MRVIVISHHAPEGRDRRTFEGTEEDIRKSLLHTYSWLSSKFGLQAPLNVLVPALDKAQAYSAVIDDGSILIKNTSLTAGVGSNVLEDFGGHDAGFQKVLRAAAFLGSVEPSPLDIRRARMAFEHDDVAAALQAYGLDLGLRGVLESILDADTVRERVNKLAKAEIEADGMAPHPKEVHAVLPDGEKFAELVRKAIDSNQLYDAKLGGKHSAGSMIAYHPEEHIRILLKPGAGPQNPAAGEDESKSSQSKREACFYAASKVFGLQEVIPEVHLLLLDGKEYAAGKLLDFDYQNMNRIRAADVNKPARLFHLFRPTGELHRWAVMDYVLGNPDRNAGNVMNRGDSIGLIDHGSAFAGDLFNPAHDLNSFVPYYLRATAPDNFHQMSPTEKLRALPRVSAAVEEQLTTWLKNISGEELAATLYRYGIDPGPSIRRLDALRSSLGPQPTDLAILSFWVM